jgi:DNA-binding transcriptional MocR family regulator
MEFTHPDRTLASDSAETEDEGEESGRAAGSALRDQVRSYLEARMSEGGGHAVISTRAIADAFHVTPTTISHHLHTLANQGVITTRSAGRKGLIISVPDAPRRGRRSVRDAKNGNGATAAPAMGKAQGGPYCPWCGQKVQKEWHYCMACGEKLA